MNHADAFYQTVHSAAGGCEALAVRLGMALGILRNKANPNCTTNHPTLDEVDRLMGITADYRILDALAANHGRVCVAVESGADASDLAVLEIMTKVWTSNGEFGVEVNNALADGKIEQHEIVAIKNAVMNANRQMQQLVARLEGMVEK